MIDFKKKKYINKFDITKLYMFNKSVLCSELEVPMCVLKSLYMFSELARWWENSSIRWQHCSDHICTSN